MTKTLEDASAEAGKQALDEMRYTLDQARYQLDASWPRKWGSVIAGPMIAALVTGSIAIIGTHESNNQRDIENNRTSMEMYFQHAAANQPDRSKRIKAITLIAANKELIAELEGEQTQAAIQAGNGPPSNSAVGQPDAKPVPTSGTYAATDFLAYIQYAETRDADQQKVRSALTEMGLTTPAAQKMDLRRSPNGNEIRIYRDEHRVYANQLAAQLKRDTGLTFAVPPKVGKNLPNGIIEIWIGKS